MDRQRKGLPANQTQAAGEVPLASPWTHSHVALAAALSAFIETFHTLPRRVNYRESGEHLSMCV